MLIAGVLCVVAAVAALVFGARTLARPRTSDPDQLVRRALAPAQVAVGVLLGVGGAVALAGPAPAALMVLIICVTGALGTLAAGAWQGARIAARQPVDVGCGSGCGCAAAAAPAATEPGCGCGCSCG